MISTCKTNSLRFAIKSTTPRLIAISLVLLLLRAVSTCGQIVSENHVDSKLNQANNNLVNGSFYGYNVPRNVRSYSQSDSPAMKVTNIGRSGTSSGNSYWAEPSGAAIASIANTPIQISSGSSSGSYDMTAGASSIQNSYGIPPASSSGGGGWGSGSSQSQPQPMVFYYQNIPKPISGAGTGSGSGWGWGWDDEEDDGDLDLSSLIGLVGLTGLKGLKGLKGVKALKAIKGLFALPLLFPLLLPLLLPLKLLALLPLLLLLILFIPVPVNPGRSMDLNANDTSTTHENETLHFHGRSTSGVAAILTQEYIQIFESVLNSSDCIERISCEINRVGRDHKFEQVHLFTQKLSSKLSSVNPSMSEKIEAGVTKSQVGCSKYKCLKSIF